MRYTAYLSAVAGSALLVPGTNSGGLKYFRGSWLCPDRGPVTWRPPVQTGPRELRCPYGRGGPVTFIVQSGRRRPYPFE